MILSIHQYLYSEPLYCVPLKILDVRTIQNLSIKMTCFSRGCGQTLVHAACFSSEVKPNESRLSQNR